MPTRANYTVFYIVNNVIRPILAQYRKYSNVGEYLLGLYGWIEEFRARAVRLREGYPDAWKNYYTTSYNGGIVVLEDYLVHPNQPGTFQAVYERQNVNRMKRYALKNDDATRKKAVLYLEKVFADCITEPAKVIDDMATKVREALTSGDCGNRGLSIPAEGLYQYAQHAKKDGDWYDVLASLLIYAQSQMLPVNPPQAIQQQLENNIYMASKRRIQDIFPLEERCLGAERIVLVNYAGTSFIAGPTITSEASEDWKRFFYNMTLGGTRVDIVLTDPASHAAEDAAAYKMRPRTISPKYLVDSIINKNLDILESFITGFPSTDVNVYLTKVALPCAYMKSEFKDQNLDNIKVDLYLPSFGTYGDNGVLQEEWQCDDLLRQSFMVYRKTQSELFTVYSRNIEEIIRHSKPVFFKK